MDVSTDEKSWNFRNVFQKLKKKQKQCQLKLKSLLV